MCDSKQVGIWVYMVSDTSKNLQTLQFQFEIECLFLNSDRNIEIKQNIICVVLSLFVLCVCVTYLFENNHKQGSEGT
jgi:hypothetical protein